MSLKATETLYATLGVPYIHMGSTSAPASPRHSLTLDQLPEETTERLRTLALASDSDGRPDSAASAPKLTKPQMPPPRPPPPRVPPGGDEAVWDEDDQWDDEGIVVRRDKTRLANQDMNKRVSTTCTQFNTARCSG